MDIVETIKELAKSRNMNLKELALHLGIGENSIYRWNKSTPSLENLSKVADYFDVSVDYLLGRNVDKEEDRTFVQINRKAKEMTPEQRQKALKIWEAAFDDEDLWGKDKKS